MDLALYALLNVCGFLVINHLAMLPAGLRLRPLHNHQSLCKLLADAGTSGLDPESFCYGVYPPPMSVTADFDKIVQARNEDVDLAIGLIERTDDGFRITQTPVHQMRPSDLTEKQYWDRLQGMAQQLGMTAVEYDQHTQAVCALVAAAKFRSLTPDELAFLEPALQGGFITEDDLKRLKGN